MNPQKKLANSNRLLATLAVLMLAGPAQAAQKKGPLKVFILAGQSNMDGQADVRTIDFLGEDPDPAQAALLKKLKPEGKLMTRGDVWVTSADVSGDLGPGFGGRKDYSKLGHCIGPEYSFGYYMAEASQNQLLLIKYAPGGQSLYKNFRPPSARRARGQKTRGFRRAISSHGQVRPRGSRRPQDSDFPSYDEKAGYEIVGMVWFQGFNDMIEGGKPVAEYAQNLKCLIKDLRKEFKSPDMKVVVGVMGVNGVRNEGGKQGDIRKQMRSMNDVPAYKGNVKAIETAPLLDARVIDLLTAGWLNKDRDLQKNPLTAEEKAMIRRATSNKGFHYNGEGRFFILLGKAMAEAMLELMGEKK